MQIVQAHLQNTNATPAQHRSPDNGKKKKKEQLLPLNKNYPHSKLHPVAFALFFHLTYSDFIHTDIVCPSVYRFAYIQNVPFWLIQAELHVPQPQEFIRGRAEGRTFLTLSVDSQI